MPPSGYSTDQSDRITEFLRSCAQALRDESVAAGRPLREGLAKEIRDIQSALPSYAQAGVAAPVLSLTGVFYDRLLAHNIENESDFWRAVEREITAARDSVLGVHVLA